MAPDNPTTPPTDPQPFEPSTGNLDRVGPPPETPETAVTPLADKTVAAFEARATEAAIQADLRVQGLAFLRAIGEPAARAILGLPV